MCGLLEEKKTDSSNWQHYSNGMQSKQKLKKFKHSESTQYMEHIMKKEKGRRGIMQNEEQVIAVVEALIMLARGAELASDLSQQFGERDDDNHLKKSNVQVTHRMEDLVHLDDQENKSQKKPTVITPTVHNGFSFSIIHLLSAVRMAMITTLPEDPSHVGQHHPLKMNNMPCLAVQEIFNRVKSNHGDPQILKNLRTAS
ncbi:nuclear factor related to kappa-B-binding protein [Tanacetum coccineum]|uniref:Nuclear factor related to kappa-B-binding protein n=1 Tax=Tanacetum coccineum TaxID=301880 RepID=A0ABQ5IRW6_9ASTR